MQYKDYYEILGVSRDADEKTVKQAYRRLARKYHPDVSKEANAEERFKELQEAYEVLKDQDKRKAYDQFGEHWKAGMEYDARNPGGTGEFYRDSVRPEDVADFGDLFGSIFGDFARQGRHQASWRGQDEFARISVTLEEAYQGIMKTISLESWELDEKGHPSRKHRTLRVKIPAGVTNNQRIRLAGQGQKGAGKGGGQGDLYLTVNIKPHPSYRVDKRDLYLEVPVTPWEAALGDKITVPTLAGKIKLTIPPGSQSGRELRLRGMGLAGYPPGDLFAVLKVILPDPKNDSERELYRKMEQTMKFDPRSQMRS